MFENITLNGITSLSDYPKCKHTKYCKQCLESQKIMIPKEKPDIEFIDDIKAYVQVNEYKIINTILGPKILINGMQKIRVLYTACNLGQSISSFNVNIPFYEFILLDDINYDQCRENINNIFIGIEDIYVYGYNKKNIELALSLIIFPQFYV